MTQEAHAQFRLITIRQDTIEQGVAEIPALSVTLVPTEQGADGALSLLIAGSSLSPLFRTATIEQEYSVIFVPVPKKEEV